MGCSLTRPNSLDVSYYIDRKLDIPYEIIHKTSSGREIKKQTAFKYLLDRNATLFEFYNVNPFVKDMIRTMNSGNFIHRTGSYKDVFVTEKIVYSVEICSKQSYYIKRDVFSKLDLIEDRSNIVIPLDVYYAENMLFQSMEVFDIDLFDFMVQENVGNYDMYKNTIDYMVYDLTSALIRLFAFGIYTTDLKPENILIKNGERISFHLSDLEDSYLLHKLLPDELYFNNKIVRKDYFDKNILPWVRTKEYCPDNLRPLCPVLAKRNVCYALCKIIIAYTAVVGYGLNMDELTEDASKEKYIQDCIKFLDDIPLKKVNSFLIKLNTKSKVKL
jgi:hypothetical protein